MIIMEQSYKKIKLDKLNKLNKDIVLEIIVCMEKYKKTNGIHSLELLEKLQSNRKEKEKSLFSPTTFNKYMKILTQAGIVARRVKSHKNVIYELDDKKIKEWREFMQVEVSGNTLEELGKLANNLNAYNKEIFFGLFGIVTKQKVERLMCIRDSCQKIINQLDFLGLPDNE